MAPGVFALKMQVCMQLLWRLSVHALHLDMSVSSEPEHTIGENCHGLELQQAASLLTAFHIAVEAFVTH